MKRKVMAVFWCWAVTVSLSVTAFAQRMLIPVGKVVGLSLTEGSVTVAAFDDTLGAAAREAGIQIGDEIVSVDGQQIDSAADLHQAMLRSGGRVELVLRRGDRERKVTMEPAITADGPKLGVMIREGVTGIGTVTYYDPQKQCFGALGHGVSDSRGMLCQMEQGRIYEATVAGIRAGIPGKPGQLRGAVTDGKAAGHLEKNTSFGIFGQGICYKGEALPAADGEDVQPGEAWILSNISGSETQRFEIEIVKVYHQEPSNGRDMMIRVTDPELLAQTGGIVAGMSGSPICQNGKIVGAVTHVLVNDPTTGYGIFIENMLAAAA